MLKRVLRLSPWSIALGYLFFGAAWILFSDTLVLAIVTSAESIQLVQAAKGLLFVLITTLFIWYLTSRLVGHLKASLTLSQTAHSNYLSLFLYSPVPMVVFNVKSNRIIEVNQSFLSAYGYSPRTICKESILTLFESESMCQVEQAIKSAMHYPTSKRNSSLEVMSVTLDGELINVAMSVHLLDNHESSRGIMVLTDITRSQRFLKHMEQALHRLDIAREVSGLGFWEIDLETNQVLCCENVIEMLSVNIAADTPVDLDQLERQINNQLFSQIKEELSAQSDGSEIRKEVLITSENQSEHHVVVHAKQSQYDNTNSIIGTFIDITRQKNTELRLRAREEQLSGLIDLLPDGLALFADNKLEYCNQTAASIVGFDDVKELTGKSIYDFVGPEVEESVKQRVSLVLQGENLEPEFMPRKLIRKDGSEVDVEIAANRIEVGGRFVIQIVIRDLTEALQMQRKLSVANRRLAALSQKTFAMLENERKRIAGELHDDIGQSLTAIKLATRWLLRRLDDEKLIKKVEDVSEIVGDTLEKVRDMSLMLRPSQLDSLGLPEAIEWQADRLFPDEGILFKLDAKEYSHQLAKEVETTAFRIAQECLTNIVRHAKARSVEVILQTDKHHLEMTVVDDGIGFDINRRKGSTGLLNMQERVELAEGNIEVRSMPKVGTSIRVTLPLKTESVQWGENGRVISGESYVE